MMMLSGEYMEQQFEIMNPASTGIDRLFNEEDRTKLRTITNQLNDYLTDITAEENDQKYGYISKASTLLVPDNPVLAN